MGTHRFQRAGLASRSFLAKPRFGQPRTLEAMRTQGISL
jgi:hypothetical protein